MISTIYGHLQRIQPSAECLTSTLYLSDSGMPVSRERKLMLLKYTRLVNIHLLHLGFLILIIIKFCNKSIGSKNFFVFVNVGILKIGGTKPSLLARCWWLISVILEGRDQEDCSSKPAPVR
jgi:hypothetical protein